MGLHGIDRAPKTHTAIYTNLRKCLEHLRTCERMSDRYLWAPQDILEGKEPVIWGLLDDMWHFYNRKSKAAKCSEDDYGPRPEKSMVIHQQKSVQRSPPAQEAYRDGGSKILSASFTETRGEKPNARSQCTPEAARIHGQRTARSQMSSRSPLRQKDDLPASTARVLQQRETPGAKTTRTDGFTMSPNVPEEIEGETRDWLRVLGLSVMFSLENEDLLRNPFRNGVLLCEVSCCCFEVNSWRSYWRTSKCRESRRIRPRPHRRDRTLNEHCNSSDVGNPGDFRWASPLSTRSSAEMTPPSGPFSPE